MIMFSKNFLGPWPLWSLPGYAYDDVGACWSVC